MYALTKGGQTLQSPAQNLRPRGHSGATFPSPGSILALLAAFLITLGRIALDVPPLHTRTGMAQ